MAINTTRVKQSEQTKTCVLYQIGSSTDGHVMVTPITHINEPINFEKYATLYFYA